MAKSKTPKLFDDNRDGKASSVWPPPSVPIPANGGKTADAKKSRSEGGTSLTFAVLGVGLWLLIHALTPRMQQILSNFDYTNFVDYSWISYLIAEIVALIYGVIGIKTTTGRTGLLISLAFWLICFFEAYHPMR